MLRVTIERIDDDTGRVKQSCLYESDQGEDENIGAAIGWVLDMLRVARMDEIIADIIHTAHLCESFFWCDNYFSGRNDAISNLITAAKTIKNGWNESDKKWNGNI